jgi:Flp pilus assembly protein TadG
VQVSSHGRNADNELDKMLATHTNEEKGSLGQAAVEFALVLLFLFILFVSMLELILMMHAYNTLADSAKEGVRYAIVHGTGNSSCSGPGTATISCSGSPYSQVQAAVTNYAGLSLHSTSTMTINVDYNPNGANGSACNVPGCMVKVTVQYPYQPLFGLGWPTVTIYAAASGRIMN